MASYSPIRQKLNPITYLDVDDWAEAETCRLEYARYVDVFGELLFLSAILDSALQSIFTRRAECTEWHSAEKNGVKDREKWDRERRASDLEWLFESSGPFSAREICRTLQQVGWSRTVKHWPVRYDKLCETVKRGLSMKLVLDQDRYKHPIGWRHSVETIEKMRAILKRQYEDGTRK